MPFDNYQVEPSVIKLQEAEYIIQDPNNWHDGIHYPHLAPGAT